MPDDDAWSFENPLFRGIIVHWWTVFTFVFEVDILSGTILAYVTRSHFGSS